MKQYVLRNPYREFYNQDSDEFLQFVHNGTLFNEAQDVLELVADHIAPKISALCSIPKMALCVLCIDTDYALPLLEGFIIIDRDSSVCYMTKE